MTKKARYAFATGNAFTATLLLAFDLSLALRHWVIDVPIAAGTLLLLVSALKAVMHPVEARHWLRMGAWVLLILGVAFTSISALTFAFLTGVHGQLLRHGTETLLFVLAASIPYLLAYPLVLLASTTQRDQA